MTVTDGPTQIRVPARSREGSDYLERARALVSLIESEAGEGERTRTVTDKVAHALRDAGLPWMLVPKSMRGGGLRLADFVEVNETIAAADASVGWILQAYAIGTGLWSGFLEPATAERLLLRDDQQMLCGSFFPLGRATHADGGVKVTGRWTFGSGAVHSDYIGGAVLVYDDAGDLCLNPDGSPDMRFAILPRDQVTLEGNWEVSGLVGTDSQDYSADEVFVPEDMAPIAPAANPNLPDG